MPFSKPCPGFRPREGLGVERPAAPPHSAWVVGGRCRVFYPTASVAGQGVAECSLFCTQLRESARSGDRDKAAAAMKLISLGRQGKLTYLLTEGLHGVDEVVARTAVESMVSLARWVSSPDPGMAMRKWVEENPADVEEHHRLYAQVTEERRDRADGGPGDGRASRRYGAEILLAALFLRLAGEQDAGHSAHAQARRAERDGRRLQQPPASERLCRGISARGIARAACERLSACLSPISKRPVLDGLF